MPHTEQMQLEEEQHAHQEAMLPAWSRDLVFQHAMNCPAHADCEICDVPEDDLII